MARKVRVTKVPASKGGGLNQNEAPIKFDFQAFPGSAPDVTVKNTLGPTSRENANVEAEKGEVVITNFMKDGIPEMYTIGGKPHHSGGTPLNLPNSSFIFSKDKNLKIQDPNILQMFGKNKSGKGKKSYTPADIAKQYKLNEYRKVLADPESTQMQRDTAERMIQNYTNKLGALAMVQESQKGFPDGIPALAMGYLQNTGINPEELMQPNLGQGGQNAPMFQVGGEFKPHMMYDPNTGASVMANNYMDHVHLSNMGYTQKKQTGGPIDNMDYSDYLKMDLMRLKQKKADMSNQMYYQRQGSIAPWFTGPDMSMSEVRASEQELRDHWADLSPEQKEMYRWLRDNITTQSGQVQNKVEQLKQERYQQVEKNPDGTVKMQEGGQTGRQYILDRRGIPLNYRYASYTGVNPDVQDDQGNPGYFANYSKPIGPTTSFDGFDFTADSSDHAYFDASLEGDYRAVFVPEGEDDPYAQYVTGSQYGKDSRIKNKFMKRMQYGGQAGGGQGATTGGQPKTDRPTKVQNIPDDAVKWDESAEGYDETQIQPGDYIKKSDGKWYRVSGYKASPYTYDFEDSRLVGEAGDLQEPYGRLEQMLLDPNNQEFRDAWLKGYREELKNTKPVKKTGLTQEHINQALQMTDDEIIQNFLNMEKQIMGVNASGIGGKGMDPEDSWDHNRANYVDTVTKLGFEPLDIPDQAAFQASYITLNNMSKDPQYKDQLEDFRMAQEGRDDEDVSGLRTGSISQVDGWVGNTTIGQAALYKPVEKELQIDEVDWQDVPEPLETPTLQGTPPEQYAPWWLQDIIKTAGAAGDFARIKKHMPWQATPGVYLPTPTFYDPTRELAANAEQANIASQAAGVFAGPQAMGARSSAIQGQAAKNVADIMGRYNNMNVQTANQFEMNKSQILNQASLNKANLATQLYDKNVIANQQFDNAKNQARQQMRQAYIDAITNRAEAQVMNQLYPQYNIDPSTGGFMSFTKGRPLTPTNSNQAGLMDLFQDYKNMNPGVSDDVIYKMAAADMGVPANSGAPGVDPSFFANYANMMGG